MNWKLVDLGIIIFCGILALFWSSTTTAASASSEYHYEVILAADGVVRNLTLILPLPQGSHAEETIEAITAGNFTGGGKDWTYTILEARKSRMLKIAVPVVSPLFHPLPVPVPETQEISLPGLADGMRPFSVRRETAHRIATQAPQGMEPLISPAEDGAPVACRIPGPEQSSIRCLSTKTWIFTDSTADQDTKLTILIGFSGSNSRWWPGWSSESYAENVYVVLKGEQHGWREAEVRLAQGIG